MNFYDILLAKKMSGGSTPDLVLIDKTITENGTYNASEDEADGYSSVTVEVEQGEEAVQGYLLINPETPKTLTSFRTKIFVPEGIEELGFGSLSNDSRIIEIELPSTLKTIGDNTFNGGSRLIKITCKAIKPPKIMGADVFGSVPHDCAIYVPAESVDAYKTSYVWNTRAAYIQAIAAQ